MKHGKTTVEPLRVAVNGRNMPITEALRTYVVGKMSKLDRYLDRLSEIEVILSQENAKESSRRNVAEASTWVNGHEIRATIAEADMYAAVDGLVDKLHLQMTKLKERTRNHKGGAPRTDLDVDELVLPVDTDDVIDEGPRIVPVRQYSMKPVFPEEAIEELEERGHAFYVFLSAETEAVNVLYKRADGSYGLVEPAFD
jgi:putative sigma-54 modulation protein